MHLLPCKKNLFIYSLEIRGKEQPVNFRKSVASEFPSKLVTKELNCINGRIKFKANEDSHTKFNALSNY